MNMSAELVALVPPGVVTVMSVAPEVRAGAVAVSDVSAAVLLAVTFVAAVLPNITLLAPLKFVPVIVTIVPPAVLPVFGLMLVMVGAATGAT